MKQFLFLLLCMASLCSCHVLKKTNKASKTNTEISTKTTSTNIGVKKKDSSGTNTEKTNFTQKVDSSYTKTTTIVREWFSDEFGEGEDTLTDPKGESVYVGQDIYRNFIGGEYDTPSYKKTIQPGKLKKRETITTQEKGFKNVQTDAAMLNENAGEISGVDSNWLYMDGGGVWRFDRVEKESSKFNLSVVPWYVWVFLIVAIVGAIYLKVKFF